MSVGGFLSLNADMHDLDYSVYEEDQAEKMIEDMLTYGRIVGFNVLDFDWLVLEPYTTNNKIDAIAEKTFDIFRFFRMKERQFVGLADLGSLNFGVSKTHDSRDIPKM